MLWRMLQVRVGVVGVVMVMMMVMVMMVMVMAMVMVTMMLFVTGEVPSRGDWAALAGIGSVPP